MPCRQVTIVTCALRAGDVIHGLCPVGRRRYAHTSILPFLSEKQRSSGSSSSSTATSTTTTTTITRCSGSPSSVQVASQGGARVSCHGDAPSACVRLVRIVLEALRRLRLEDWQILRLLLSTGQDARGGVGRGSAHPVMQQVRQCPRHVPLLPRRPVVCPPAPRLSWRLSAESFEPYIILI